MQYDLEKTVRTGSLNRPPNVLLNAVSSLQARYLAVDSKLPKFLSKMQSRRPKLKAMTTRPGADQHRLFEANYSHRAGEATCARCEGDRLVTRSERSNNTPSIHYDLIASGNQVMKDGVSRDKLRKELNMLCFEMEAASQMPYTAAVTAAYAKQLPGIIPGNRLYLPEQGLRLLHSRVSGPSKNCNSNVRVRRSGTPMSDSILSTWLTM